MVTQGAGNAANPKQHALADLLRHLAAHYNVGHGKASPRLEYTECLLQDTVLVC